MTSLDSPQKWLVQTTLPLWINSGVDKIGGGFFEALSPQGEALHLPRRAMVQARQLYSFRIALEKKWVNAELVDSVHDAMARGTTYLVQKYSVASGAFIQSVTAEGLPQNTMLDLYTQAFALFGLANAYAIQPKPETKKRAQALVQYLNVERRLSVGGFSEIKEKANPCDANPHMHIFEAAISWMEVDSDPLWKNLAKEVVELCLNKFIDPSSGALIQYFSNDWKPVLFEKGFVIEPGQQYEWAWLMRRYEKLTGMDLSKERKIFFQIGEDYGVCQNRKVVYDEIWSDLTPKTKTSRFWPQCERIKCASDFPTAQMVVKNTMKTLLPYFKTPTPGLWYDKMDEAGGFKSEPAKASSLYHIIAAIAAYDRQYPE